MMERPVSESSRPVGSSATIRSASSARARATATRCCRPPQSSPGGCRRAREADQGEQGPGAFLALVDGDAAQPHGESFPRPRRTRCSGCKVTHVLSAEMLWPRRPNAAVVIGAGLEMAALGLGHCRAPPLWPAGWDGPWLVAGVRRAGGGRAPSLHRRLVALADDPVIPDATASPFAGALSAVATAHRTAATRWPHMLAVSPWGFRAIGSRLLASPSSAV